MKVYIKSTIPYEQAPRGYLAGGRVHDVPADFGEALLRNGMALDKESYDALPGRRDAAIEQATSKKTTESRTKKAKK